MGMWRKLFSNDDNSSDAAATAPASPTPPPPPTATPAHAKQGDATSNVDSNLLPQQVIGGEIVQTDALPDQMQRALSAMVSLAQQLDTRLVKIESQLAKLEPGGNGVATQDDVQALKTENARIAAELAQSTINLRERIDEVEFNKPPATAHDARVAKLAGQILNLSDAYNTQA